MMIKAEPTRRVLITGAGSGLGRGLAVELARQGHYILVVDLNRRGAEQTVEELLSIGSGEAHELDVTNDLDIEEFFRKQDQVDVLINNAGLQHVCPLEQFPMEQWVRLIDVMLQGACRMTRAALPCMRSHGFGRIINIGSIHSLVASAYKTAYVAAKHGLLGFAKVVALETADTDITINTICPAYIRTPLVDAQIASQAQSHGISEEQVIEQIFLAPMPKKQFVTCAEVAALVAYLVSPAAGNVTGQAIAIDGGWTAQ